MKTKQLTMLLLVPVLFVLIYAHIFTANFAYLDEIYQLWHHQDGANYNMFATQGRWLSGLLFNKLFGAIDSIAQIKYLRIFSWTGWVITTVLWWLLFNKWAIALNLDKRLAWLVNVFVICCVPVAVYIGWASCLEVFLAVSAALISAHILFSYLAKQQQNAPISFIVIAGTLIFGVISLFLYQTAFGVFLLPFFLQYVVHKKAKPGRIVVIGIVFYFVTYVVYYGLFTYSLSHGITASTRVGISLSIFKKLSFFFAEPLAQSFCVNYLFSPRSIVAQILYPLLFAFWLISTFIRNRAQKKGTTAGYILFVLMLLLLIYLPLMIAMENFASYRTLFALNVAVFILLAEAVLALIKNVNSKNIFTIICCTVLVMLSFYNFNAQYLNPLTKEYAAIKSYMQQMYRPGITKVYFIRPDKNLFAAPFGVRTYKDELGVPSTYRDWVPEPLVKQMVYEQTKNRALAEALPVVQFENKAAFDSAHVLLLPTEILLNMDNVFGRALAK